MTENPTAFSAAYSAPVTQHTLALPDFEGNQIQWYSYR
jgi:hypothetical protein